MLAAFCISTFTDSLNKSCARRGVPGSRRGEGMPLTSWMARWGEAVRRKAEEISRLEHEADLLKLAVAQADCDFPALSELRVDQRQVGAIVVSLQKQPDVIQEAVDAQLLPVEEHADPRSAPSDIVHPLRHQGDDVVIQVAHSKPARGISALPRQARYERGELLRTARDRV